MKLATFMTAGEPRLGAVTGDSIVDLAVADPDNPAFSSMQALIEGGERALDAAREQISAGRAGIALQEVELLAPLPNPPQMRDFLVFEEHMRMAGWRGAQLRERLGGAPAPSIPPPIPAIWYEQPIYYKCNRFAVAGTGAQVCWPSNSSVIDYELELACVIGRKGRDVLKEDAAGHIFGYTIFNDLTARDLQFREMQGPLGPAKGKDFDDANVLGPVIVTADEFPSLADVHMRAFVNGEIWSEGSARNMHWSFPEMIEHLSRSETIYPGEILGSGTVGSGCGLELGKFLQHGDHIVLEIDGIGRLETLIDAPHVSERLSL